MTLEKIFERRRQRAQVPQRSVRMRRQFDHFDQMFLSTGAASQPNKFEAKVSPGIDLFGSAKLKEWQYETITTAAGITENFHSRVPEGRVRHYITAEITSNDLVLHNMMPAINLSTGAIFPSVGIEDQTTFSLGDFLTVRDVLVPPRVALGFVANGLGALAQITAQFVWVDMPIGEYIVVP